MSAYTAAINYGQGAYEQGTASSSSVWTWWSRDNGTCGVTQATGNQIFGRSQTWSDWTSVTTSGSLTINAPVTISNCWIYWNNGSLELSRGAEFTARQEQRQKEQEERQRQREQAEATAQELLEDLLTPEEAELYKKHGRVLVRGKTHDYIVSKTSGHIKRIDKGKVVDLCVQIADHHSFVPTDNVIGMKLFIENREKEIDKNANNYGVKDLLPDEVEFLRAVGQ